ncbi:MAG: sigma-70 family RNA polymerase sigma factor [Deltaproteobacteria bacterium]|nr:sigma-70 family RNA polymerase sigma factor [Deltaproteobacteria bacterium]
MLVNSLSALSSPDLPHKISIALQGDALAQEQVSHALLEGLRVLVDLCLHRLGFHIQPFDIDDLVQELVMSCWKTDLKRFDSDKGDLIAFLITRVRWRILDFMRELGGKRERFGSYEIRVLDEDEADCNALICEVDYEGDLDEKHRQQKLKAFPKLQLLELAEQDLKASEAVLRHDAEGDPMNEVAKDWGVHPATVSRARARGLVFLRENLCAQEGHLALAA